MMEVYAARVEPLRRLRWVASSMRLPDQGELDNTLVIYIREITERAPKADHRACSTKWHFQRRPGGLQRNLAPHG